MNDQPDKMAMPQEDPLIITLADDPSPSTSHRLEVVKSLNELYTQLDNDRKGITAEFIENASREQLHTKQLEIDTILQLYRSKYLELNVSELKTESRNQWMTQKTFMETVEKQLHELFTTSRFNIATAKIKILDKAFAKLQNEKDGITNEFLRKATIEELQSKRSQHAQLLEEYMNEYETIKLDDLTPDEKSKVETQHQRAQTLGSNTEAFFLDEIRKKQPNKEPPSDPIVDRPHTSHHSKASHHTENKEDASQAVEALQAAHQSQLRAIQTELASLRQTNRELEQKLGSIQVMTTPSVQVVMGDENNEETQDPETQVAAGNSQSQGAVMQLKIDSIKLPYFSGELTEWLAFKDLFTDLIHNNKGLSDGVKFHQLRSHLRGVAFDTIKGYQVSGENYAAAWKDLITRFDRKDELIDEYIRKFYTTMPIIQRANYNNLRHMVDATNQMLRALPGLKVPVTNWDPMVNFIIKCKLDDHTRAEWKQLKGKKESPKTRDLLDFLETRAIELLPSQSERLSDMMRGDHRRPQNKRVVFQITEPKGNKPDNKLECLICKKNHRIWNCSMLKKESAKVRSDMIKSMGLCFKCLLKHRVGMCDNDDCEYCGGPHNVLLCYKKENDVKSGVALKTQNYQNLREPLNQRSSHEQASQQRQANRKNWQPKPNTTWQPRPSTSQQTEDNWDNEEWNKPAVPKNGRN